MDVIPADVVEMTWTEMAAGSAADARKWADRMTKEQPFVLAYLLAVGERDFNPDEAQLLFYLGTVVWQIFDRGGRQLAEVSGDELDRTEENNAQMLEYLEGESEAGFVEAVRGLLDGCAQDPPEAQIGSDLRTRQARMRERLKSGCFADVIDVVAKLYIMNSRRPLGTMDRQLLDQGKELLASELALASSVDVSAAMEELEGVFVRMASLLDG